MEREITEAKRERQAQMEKNTQRKTHSSQSDLKHYIRESEM